MNHDYTHCLDCKPSCPDECFRKQLNDDLKNITYPIVLSWSHLKDTDECKEIRMKIMGTNYYAVRNKPTIGEPIHIGKSSFGWKFCFQSHNDKWNDPPVIWNTYEQVYEWLYKYTVESDQYVIIDEYDEIISFDDFIKLVKKKQSENNPDDFTYAKNVNGYRFSDRCFE